MATPVHVRIAGGEDCAGVRALILRSSEEFILPALSAQGRAHFRAELAEPELAQRLAGPYRFYAAESGATLAGVAAVREPAHLYYLFVAREFHRQGIARALWRRVCADYLSGPETVGRMTVNASDFAVEAYRRLGFMRCAPPAERNGVRYNPMEFRAGDREAR
jgi:ribosomal protein S18 acetylase RimI-like enzyme